MNIFKRALLSLAAITPLFIAGAAHGANGADFQAGRIIDDQVFFDANALSVQQIQSFLFTQVQTCDVSGNQVFTGYYNGTDSSGINHSPFAGGHSYTSGDNIKRAQLDNRYPAPYTCLKDYVENTSTHANNIGTPTTPVSGGISSAQIIYNEAQNYSISPKVLLVLIQKESSLVTDDWPWPNEYKTATGYGCPDTAACDSTYFGFYNQVHNAARQYHLYANNPNNYNYVIGDNNIPYNPNAACGTKAITIVNQATAGLYNYTPYTPNSPALNNLYGTGDACSAYGNRNFWRLYTDWFGSTFLPSYDYSFVSSSSAFQKLDYGQQSSNTITIKNTGSSAWYADGSVPTGSHPTRLSLANYQTTPFADNSDAAWLGTKAQISMTPAVVNSGQNATFIFKLLAPYQAINSASLPFVPVVDGIGFMRDIGMKFNLSSVAPTYSYVGAGFPPATILPGQKITGSLVIKNAGTGSWYADGAIPTGKHPIRLAAYNYQTNPYASLDDPNWLGTKAQIQMTPTQVDPGQNATFTFVLVGPYAQMNQYNFHFVPVLDGVTFMQDLGMAFTISTPTPSYTYGFVSAINPPSSMAAGSSAQATIVLKNTGNTVWYNEATRGHQSAPRLVMSQPWYRSSPFINTTDTAWLTSAQISMSTAQVDPGANGTYTFSWKAPTATGNYYQHFAPVMDGVSLMTDIGMAYATTVTP